MWQNVLDEDKCHSCCDFHGCFIFDVFFRSYKSKKIEVSPSEPKYYQYEFPKDVDSVEVRVTSPDQLCAIVSIQDINVRIQKQFNQPPIPR